MAKKNSSAVRNIDFLVDILHSAKRNAHKDKVRHAKSDQINAVSEMTVNLLHNKSYGKQLKIKPHHIVALRKNKASLEHMTKKKNSVKKRRSLLLSQKGGSMLKALATTILT